MHLGVLCYCYRTLYITDSRSWTQLISTVIWQKEYFTVLYGPWIHIHVPLCEDYQFSLLYVMSLLLHSRWRVVIHGGIDGFSRVPVYLKCSATNSAQKVREYFVEAVATFGLPRRVRSDMGGENIGVAQFMWSQPHDSFYSTRMIMGRSVHNQRIERLWRDLFQGCIGLYYQLFTYLENIGLLDPCNEVHLFVLHFIYMPWIQRSLDHYCQAYIHHPISSYHNRTPAQLFIAGLIEANQQGADQTYQVLVLCHFFHH